MQDTWISAGMGLDSSSGMVISGHHPQLHPAYAVGKRLWRKGKWTDEEEKYTKRLISAFNQGLLRLSPGTTLRCFLSEKLNCDPMRISKKFAGSSCIGKQVFQPNESSPENSESMNQIEAEIAQLEEQFLLKVESSEKTMLYPTPPPMWTYAGDPHGMYYGLPAEYLTQMPAVVVPHLAYPSIPDVIDTSPEMYMHMGLGMPQPSHPIAIPQSVSIPMVQSHPPPESKKSTRNYDVPEMKQLPESKVSYEDKAEGIIPYLPPIQYFPTGTSPPHMDEMRSQQTMTSRTNQRVIPPINFWQPPVAEPRDNRYISSIGTVQERPAPAPEPIGRINYTSQQQPSQPKIVNVTESCKRLRDGAHTTLRENNNNNNNPSTFTANGINQPVNINYNNLPQNSNITMKSFNSNSSSSSSNNNNKIPIKNEKVNINDENNNSNNSDKLINNSNNNDNNNNNTNVDTTNANDNNDKQQQSDQKHNGTKTDREATDLLMNFFNTAATTTDRDNGETTSDSSSNFRNSVEGKSDSSNNEGNSGEYDSSSSNNSASSGSSEEKSDSSRNGGNSGSDADNSSQEEEVTSNSRIKPDLVDSDEQQQHRSSRGGRSKGGGATISDSQALQSAAVDFQQSNRRSDYQNRRYLHHQHHMQQQQQHQYYQQQQQQQQQLPPYQYAYDHAAMNYYPRQHHYAPPPPGMGHHHPTLPPPGTTGLPPQAMIRPHYPGMHESHTNGGYPSQQQQQPQLMPLGAGGVHPHHQQQQAAVAAAVAMRSKAGLHRARSAAAAAYGISAPPSVPTVAPGGGGTFVETSNGPVYVWREVNNMGVVVENMIPCTYMMPSSYQMMKQEKSMDAIPDDDQRSFLHSNISRNSRQNERTERRYNDSNPSKRAKVDVVAAATAIPPVAVASTTRHNDIDAS